jgi:hypothetical protein
MTGLNPYPCYPGFGGRVRTAAAALRKRANGDTDIFTRAFDNCFEMYDGSAVVWALMFDALEMHDTDLKTGIKSMGPALWEDWMKVYRADDIPKQQYELPL